MEIDKRGGESQASEVGLWWLGKQDWRGGGEIGEMVRRRGWSRPRLAAGQLWTQWGALLEAMVEVGIIAKNYGIQQVLFLTDRVNLHQVFKQRKSTDWLDRHRIADLNFLSQLGLFCNTVVVPHIVVKVVWCSAKQAINRPLYHRWYNSALYNHV